ncbi:MAG: DDE-type integrase/transposase/recombinase [Anaerolineae bacterium]|nr:DDE-type integrase/transposase/recombinase [Anaerolineae bacterium]
MQQASGPRQVVQVDTLDLGEVYAYTAIDTFTREAAVVIRPTRQATEGRAALVMLMQHFGWVQVLQTDGGSEFKAKCAESITHFATRHRIGLPYKKNEQPSLKPSTARCAVRSLVVNISGPASWRKPSRPLIPSWTTITIAAPTLPWL